MGTNAFQTVEMLLVILKEQTEITRRRILKSGANHFAISRFDAVTFVLRNYLLVPASSTQVSQNTEFKKEISALGSSLEELVADFPDLDPSKRKRNSKDQNRTLKLIEELLDSVGYTQVDYLAGRDLYNGYLADKLLIDEFLTPDIPNNDQRIKVKLI